MEEGSHLHFDNLLCEISPLLLSEKILKCWYEFILSLSWRAVMGDWRVTWKIIWYSIENFHLLTILLLHLLFSPIKKSNSSSFKKTHLCSSKDADASSTALFLFSSQHWELQTKWHICSKIWTHLSKSSDASPAPALCVPYFSSKFKTKQIPHTHANPTTSKKAQPLLTVVVGRSLLAFPVPDLTCVFWRTYRSSLPSKQSSWMRMPQRGKTSLRVWHQHGGSKCHLVWSVPMPLCLGNQAGHNKKHDYFTLRSFPCPQ